MNANKLPIRCFVLVDKDYNMIGVERDSGGYPYVAATFSSVKIWKESEMAAMFDYADHWPGRFRAIKIKISEEK
jgi:hypothetical protein